MAAKVLQLRGSDGKVLVAPAWDYRPAAAQARPLEMRVPSRALERVLQYWTKHSLAKATGESRESLARWDADFQRRLEEDGLAKEAAAAVQALRRHGVHHGGRPSRHAATAATAVAAPATATRADPVRAWCTTSRVSTTENLARRRRRPSLSMPPILPSPRALGLPPPCRPLLVLNLLVSGAPSVPVDARWLKTRSSLATTASARLPRLPMLLHP
ncbi:unnamed protein product [Triticum aestivum]|uniref:Uncharacterized protein n=3 Tax=Triticinae TaxID=1648030 RepID=A0A9R1ERG4_WHEAT|nr:hypothetical protein CFC21_028839 [Triticum aestivum]SPT17052.1 unnamed protein product [Triticum aestivum]